MLTDHVVLVKDALSVQPWHHKGIRQIAFLLALAMWAILATVWFTIGSTDT
jgi:hypothetical protein